jgi:hypothetical protein
MPNNILIIYNADYDPIQVIPIDENKLRICDARALARGAFWHIPNTLGAWTIAQATAAVDEILAYRRMIDEIMVRSPAAPMWSR